MMKFSLSPVTSRLANSSVMRNFIAINNPNTMTEAAINTGFTRDLYVSLGEPVSNGAWSVRVYYKPFVDWIWGGCLIMAFGGLLAVTDRRYRLKSKITAEDAIESAAPKQGKMATEER